MFFVCVTLGLPARRGHRPSSNKYCVTVCGSILMRYSALFSEWSVLSGVLKEVLKTTSLGVDYYIVLIFVARWRHNFREIAVKNCEKSKNRRKSLCAPLRIDS